MQNQTYQSKLINLPNQTKPTKPSYKNKLRLHVLRRGCMIVWIVDLDKAVNSRVISAFGKVWAGQKPMCKTPKKTNFEFIDPSVVQAQVGNLSSFWAWCPIRQRFGKETPNKLDCK